VKLPVAIALALAGFLSLGTSVASAATIVTETGTHGTITLTDTSDSPAVTCTYGQAQPPYAFAYLHYVKVRAPEVYAVDNTGDRDHQLVTWRFKIQGEQFGASGGWTTFAKSPKRSANARDDTPAAFTPIEVKFNSKSNPDPAFEEFVFRTLITVKWYKANGTVQGTVKLLPNYYRVKGPFGPPFTGGSEFCGAITTEG
jgi:hypothetical protein